MRIAAFVVVVAIHAMLFFVFAELRSPSRQVREAQVSEAQTPATLIFLQERELTRAVENKPPVTARAVRPAAPKAPAATRPAPEPNPDSIPEPEPASSSITPAPDWRAEAQIAANDEIEAEARKREKPSPLAPHDFSGVKPGSTDTSKPQFGWYRARTHRVEEIPTGGLVVHVNDRCAVAIVFIFPFPLCQIGKMPARSDLFSHKGEARAAGDSKLP